MRARRISLISILLQETLGGVLTFMEGLTRLAPIGVSAMIVFVAYGCQILFYFISPGPLRGEEFRWLNGLVAATWICFARACLVDPGRVPKGWKPRSSTIEETANASLKLRRRWCKRCEAPKPPRAHHCKTCQRCVPKMDHHCPWTGNCVSNRTLPHFMRMLLYATASMLYIEYLLIIRAQVIWNKRKLPSYLGPSSAQLTFFLLIFIANSLICFVVSILLLRSLWSLAMNVSTIESWEIERHRVLLRRAKALGGYLDGPEGTRVRIVKQEFPYDVGIWSNINQGMGGNLFTWLLPFARSPGISDGLEFPINEFEDPMTSWPPPDPDRMIRRHPKQQPAFVHGKDETDAERVSRFRSRQAADLARTEIYVGSQRRRPFYLRFDGAESTEPSLPPKQSEGEEAWRSSEGERLRDFGVDEGVEFYDEDEVPLQQLAKQLHSRRIRSS